MRKEIVSITGGKYGGEYGFVTSYPEGEIASSAVLYRVRKIFFYSTVQYDVHGGWIVQYNGRESWQVPIAPEINKIDIFNRRLVSGAFLLRFAGWACSLAISDEAGDRDICLQRLYCVCVSGNRA